MIATKQFIEKEANRLIDKHLNIFNRHWHFRFNKTKRSLGQCQVVSYYRGYIYISEYMVGVSKENAIDTILHEIAHALDYERNNNMGHGRSWQRIMVELGLEPLRLATKQQSLEFRENIDYKYTGVCPICGRTFNRNRMSSYAKNNLDKTYFCSKCNVNTNKDNRVYIQYTQNY